MKIRDSKFGLALVLETSHQVDFILIVIFTDMKNVNF